MLENLKKQVDDLAEKTKKLIDDASTSTEKAKENMRQRTPRNWKKNTVSYR